jgi:hypothetical protein
MRCPLFPQATSNRITCPPIPHLLNHFQIFLDRDGTYMVILRLKLSHHPRPKLPRLLRPFGFFPPISNSGLGSPVDFTGVPGPDLRHLTSFFSASCALFFATDAPQILCLQMLPHSFYRHGGVHPPLYSSTRALRERTNCALLRINSFACHTCAFHGGRGVCVF